MLKMCDSNRFFACSFAYLASSRACKSLSLIEENNGNDVTLQESRGKRKKRGGGGGAGIDPLPGA